MSVKNGILVAPVNLQEVYNYIGASWPSTGQDEGHLCSNAHGHINMWAKYKPVIYKNGVFVSDPTHSSYNKDWYKANDGQVTGDCGVRPKAVYSGAQYLLFARYIIESAERRKWDYFPPTGGINAPFRQSDFNGHNRDAKCPFGEITTYSYVLRDGSNASTVRFSLSWPFELQAESALTINDILVNTAPSTTGQVDLKTLSGWYFGVVLFNLYEYQANPSTYQKLWFASSTVAGVPAFQIEIDPLILGGFSHFLPFMCKNPMTNGSAGDQNNRLIPIPQSAPLALPEEYEMRTEDEKVSIVPSAGWVTGTTAANATHINLRLTFINNRKGPSVTFSDIRVLSQAKQGDNEPGTQFLAVSGTVTVASGKSEIKEYQGIYVNMANAKAVLVTATAVCSDGLRVSIRQSVMIMNTSSMTEGNIGLIPWP